MLASSPLTNKTVHGTDKLGQNASELNQSVDRLRLSQSADKPSQSTDQSALKTNKPSQNNNKSNQKPYRPGQEPFDNELSNLSDSILYQRCQEYGLHARVWRRRFAGLLPEVLRRNLHRRRGYASIHEFAFKLAGMSSASVDKVLYLAKRFEDKPFLRKQLLTGGQGWSKLEKVAYIATPETDKEWAEKVEKMSSHAIEAFVEIARKQEPIEKGHSEWIKREANFSFFGKSLFTENKNVENFTPGGESLNHSQADEKWGAMTFPVSTEVEKQLRLLKHQFEKEKGITLTFNEVFQILLAQQGNRGPGESTQVIIQLCPECAARKAAEVQQSKGISRAIPAYVRRVIQGMYHGFCAFPTCALPATSLHHTKRFSLERAHDPSTIVPLCKNHERLVHYGLIANEEAPPREWKVLSTPDRKHLKYVIDRKVQNHRKEPAVALSPLQGGSP